MMSDINHIENYNISQINTTTRENCDNEVKRLNKKCQESSIKIEINTKHLFNHGLIKDWTKEYEKEIKLQESCDILKIDLLHYGENSETIEHTNILIRYKNKIFSFDTYPTVNEISFWLVCNSNLNANTQTNANTIFQKDFKSCYIKSLKNAELFIDSIIASTIENKLRLLIKISFLFKIYLLVSLLNILIILTINKKLFQNSLI